jgi:hypothetical protein
MEGMNHPSGHEIHNVPPPIAIAIPVPVAVPATVPAWDVYSQ